MIDGIKYFLKLITDICKTLFKWELMPNISLGMALVFFITLSFIVLIVFNVVLSNRGD